MKESEASHTRFIVSAIIAYADIEKNHNALLSKITVIVRNEIGNALQNYNFASSEIPKNNKNKIHKNQKSEILYHITSDEYENRNNSVSRKNEKNSDAEEFDENIDMDFLKI